jgi:hypothetical protein
MGTSPIVTLEERLVKAKSSRSLQPSQKAQFITEIEILPLNGDIPFGLPLIFLNLGIVHGEIGWDLKEHPQDV